MGRGYSSTDILRDRVGVVVKIKDVYDSMVISPVDASTPKHVRLWSLK